VRLAVIKTLHSFMSVSSLPRDWLTVEYLRLLFQNLVVEERTDIRDATLAAWNLVISILTSIDGCAETIVSQPLLLEWYAVMMTPLGTPLDITTFYDAAAEQNGAENAERHNVDKNMIAQDMSLVPLEVIIAARVAAATSLAYVTAVWPTQVSILYAPCRGDEAETTGVGRPT
jgi:TATA-binding protein-associated factor